jgi:hypothetical protein
MKTLRLVILFVLVALVLSACSPAVAGLQQLPEEGRLLVFTLLSAALTWLFLKASIFFNIDINGYANAVAAALAPIVIALIESWLQLIAPIFDNIVLSIIHLVVLLVGSIGTFFLFKRQAPSLQ